MRQKTVSYSIIGSLTILGVFPLFSMILSTIYDDKGFSLESYLILFSDTALLTSLWHSFLLAFCVSLGTTIIGTVLGILLTKTNLYGRFVFLILLLIPLLIPPYILAYGWYALLGRETLLGTYLFGFMGTAWILFSVYLFIPTLLCALFLRQINPRLEEAGLLVGSWGSVLKSISLPLLQPAMLLSFLLVFILTLNELSVANFLRFDIFPLQSFTQFAAFYDFKTATIYAMPLLFIVLFGFVFVHWFLKKDLRFKTYSHILCIDTSSMQISLFVSMTLLLMLLIGLPLWGLLQNIDGQSFILALQKSFPSLTQSLLYASASSLLLVFFGFACAIIIGYHTVRYSQYLQMMLLFFFLLSSVLIGIALILFWNTPVTNFIYTSPLIVLIAYLLKYLFLTTKIIELKLSQLPHTFIEAAQLTGASWYQILKDIILPLSKQSLIIAVFIGFIFSLRESTLTMLVAPAGTSTLPMYIMTQMANGKESIIAALCLVMILIVLLPLFTLLYHIRQKGLFS